MKRTTAVFVLVILVFGAAVYFRSTSMNNQIPPVVSVPDSTPEPSANMTLTSTAFLHDQAIPTKYTCDGDNVNPPLTISGVPRDTQSLALVVDDPDAPMGTWVHWTLWNIAPTAVEISENSVPEKATLGTTSNGQPGYGGPCPPSGTHRYFFKLFALDTMIELDGKATVAELEETMKGHILAQTQLIGRFGR